MSAHDSRPSLVPLFVRVARRDEAAVNEILTRCQAQLKALTRRTLREFPSIRQWGDTSDVYGEASIRFFTALRRLTFERPADFLRLAGRQIRWTLLDLTKKKRIVGLPVGAGADFDPAAASKGPDELAMWQEFHEGVEAMPAFDQKLIDLLFYQEFTKTEVSHLLRIPYSTLKLRWQELRAAIALRFDNQRPV